MLTYQQLVQNALEKIEEVSVAELSTLLKTKKIKLLDIREANEVAFGVIPHSYWISRGLLEFQIAALIEQTSWSLEDEIYICCRSGNRSALAAVALLEMGFKKPISVAGGFNAWCDAELEISKTPLTIA